MSWIRSSSGTAIIVSAKHGQSPIDHHALRAIKDTYSTVLACRVSGVVTVTEPGSRTGNRQNWRRSPALPRPDRAQPFRLRRNDPAIIAKPGNSASAPGAGSDALNTPTPSIPKPPVSVLVSNNPLICMPLSSLRLNVS
jgi:hypothetical protein